MPELASVISVITEQWGVEEPSLLDSTVTINGNVFGNNFTKVRGGVLDIDRGTALISSCHFTNNHASYAAGVVCSRDNSHITIRESVLIGNTAGRNGGAVCVRESVAIVSGNM